MSRTVAARATALVTISLTLALGLGGGCRRNGCVGGDDGVCVPSSACPAIRFACSGPPGFVHLTELGSTGALERLSGPKAMGAAGDILLENDLVRVVIDAPSHPQNLAPSGGSIIDFAPVGMKTGDQITGDQINGIYQAAGLLPRDAVHYETWHSEKGDAYVAAILRGHLEGNPRVTVVTRYELRPCEPGLRVRSDLYNGAADPNTLYLTDGFFWGDQTLAPFVPGPGLGFRAPEVELLHIDRAWREWPLMAARSQGPPDVSYAVVPCDRPQAAGFSSTTLTASGIPLSPTLPGDGLSSERFILAVPGPGLAPAVASALRVRTMLHGDPAPVTLTGRVVAGGVPVDGHSGRAASVLFYEPGPGANPDDESRRTPWSEVVPDAHGQFSVTLPPNRAYRAQPYAFGRPAGPVTSFAVANGAADIGDITVTAPARLLVSVVKSADLPTPDPQTYAELVIVPVRATTTTAPAADTAPTFYGLFPGCDPMLGPPDGSSPACNRDVKPDGKFDLLLPPGQFYVYATRGPFAALDRRQIRVEAGNQVSLTMVVPDLPRMLPEGAVSGDFHVHGAASYDSSIGDNDRVVSFLAAGVDVVIPTDHDVVTSYANVLASLQVGPSTLMVIPGVEQTPNIIWFDVPGQDFPRTLGHFNFWPLAPDFGLPRNGSPWDELREPGQMMDDMEGQFTVPPEHAIRQLNHPYLGAKLGRDQGFLAAIGYDPATPIALGASFAADVLLRAPGGGRRNLDWDVQEVMTGTSPADWLRYRALWFSLLSQGILRAGTANSDSHGLANDQIGYPRNVVLGHHRSALQQTPVDVAAFTAAFDDDIRMGHLFGTNGPILDVSITNPAGDVWQTNLDPQHPVPVTAASTLKVTVKVAPWIPVTDIRVYVNGEVAAQQDISSQFNGTNADPYGTSAATTTPVSFQLLPLLGKAGGDAWLVVEAGLRLDADEHGLPIVRAATDPRRFDMDAIAPGAFPTAFSNPFLLDVDGDHQWSAPGLPTKAAP